MTKKELIQDHDLLLQELLAVLSAYKIDTGRKAAKVKCTVTGFDGLRT